MSQLTISAANAQKAFNSGDKENKELLKNLFPQYDFKAKIQDLVTSYADACDLVGIQPLTLSDFNYLPEVDRESTYAFHQITIIARALNQGWKPDYSNSNENKYYPYFIWDENAAGGPGFSYYDYDYDNSYSGVGARLVFKTSELAVYAGKQFIAIYNQFLKN